MTRSTLRRIIRIGQRSGAIRSGDSPLGMRALVRGFLRGRVVYRREREFARRRWHR